MFSLQKPNRFFRFKNKKIGTVQYGPNTIIVSHPIACVNGFCPFFV